jgi:hypothetical protein
MKHRRRVDAPGAIAMSKEDNGKRSGRTYDFDSYRSPWHVLRTIWPGDPKIFTLAKPVIHKDPKGFALTTHTLLHFLTELARWDGDLHVLIIVSVVLAVH